VHFDQDDKMHRQKIVISTGGGIVENPICVDILKNLKRNVIFIDRDYDEVIQVNTGKLGLVNQISSHR